MNQTRGSKSSNSFQTRGSQSVINQTRGRKSSNKFQTRGSMSDSNYFKQGKLNLGDMNNEKQVKLSFITLVGDISLIIYLLQIFLFNNN